MGKCDKCSYLVMEGGDRVPFGSTWATLPVSKYCDCPDVPDDEIDAYCEQTNFGENCKFFHSKESELDDKIDMNYGKLEATFYDFIGELGVAVESGLLDRGDETSIVELGTNLLARAKERYNAG